MCQCGRLYVRRHAARRAAGGSRGLSYIPVGARPNPYLSGGFFWYTEGNSSYNALQMDVTRRLSHGLEFRANYTWSKNLDMNSALTGAQANNQAQMVMNRNASARGLGSFGAECYASGQHLGTYELPFGGAATAGFC